MNGAIEAEDAEGVMAGRGLTLEHRPVKALIPHARNARTHSDA